MHHGGTFAYVLQVPSSPAGAGSERRGQGGLCQGRGRVLPAQATVAAARTEQAHPHASHRPNLCHVLCLSARGSGRPDTVREVGVGISYVDPEQGPTLLSNHVAKRVNCSGCNFTALNSLAT